MNTAAAPRVDAGSGSDRVLEQLRMDERLGPTELVTILAHCAAVVASADFRLLQAAALLHEDYALSYGLKMAAAVGDEPAGSVTELHAKSLDASNALGPDGLEQAIAAVGAALNTPPARARELILAGSTMRYHLPETGQMLARGRIDLARFLLIVQRTSLCAETVFPELDSALAKEIEGRPPYVAHPIPHPRRRNPRPRRRHCRTPPN